MSEETLLVAFDYLEKRRFSIFPIRPGAKEPHFGFLWTEFQHRRATLDEIEEWFLETDNNIAIVCGAISGIMVLDDDAYYYDEDDPDLSSMPTPTVRTGRYEESHHRYFLYIEGTGTIEYSRALTLRGDGRYVVAPPSVHPDGGRYHWLPDRSLVDVQPAPLPSILRQWEKPRPEHQFKTYEKPRRKGSGRIRKGERNNSFLSLAGSLISHGVTDPTELFDMLQKINLEHCDEPVPDHELQAWCLDWTTRFAPGAHFEEKDPPPGLTNLQRARWLDTQDRARKLAERYLRDDG